MNKKLEAINGCILWSRSMTVQQAVEDFYEGLVTLNELVAVFRRDFPKKFIKVSSKQAFEWLCGPGKPFTFEEVYFVLYEEDYLEV